MKYVKHARFRALHLPQRLSRCVASGWVFTTMEVGVHNRSFFFAGACCFGLTVGTAPTEAQVVREVTLDQALQLFNDNNLQIRLARSEAAVIYGDARQARSFPNPTGQFTHEQLSGNGLSYAETYFNIRQPIPFPWLLSARSTASKAIIDAASARVEADSNQIQFDIKRSIVRTIAAGRRLEVVQEVTEVFRTVEAAATARFTEGDLSGYDLRRIRIELGRYERAASNTAVRRDHARRTLTTALLPDIRDTILMPIDFLSEVPTEFDIVDLHAYALAKRPEVFARRADIVASEAQQKETRSGRWADQIVLTGGYKRQSDGLDGPFLGAELPLPLWNRKGGAVAANDARLTAARERAALIERVILDDVQMTARGYESAKDRVTRIEQRLYEDTDDLLDIARASYDEGETDLLELLDAADAYYVSRSDRIELRAELWEQYFDLERAVGGFTTMSHSPGGAE